MKKKINKPMRAAGALLVATMLTTCMTAGTFAKYVTTDSATDSARVAKFGVVVNANGNLYGKEYKDSPTDYSTYQTNTSTTVQAFSDSNDKLDVVAPGTKNETGMGLSVEGTPEVDVAVGYTLNAINIRLNAGRWGVMKPVKYQTKEQLTAAFNAETAEGHGIYTVSGTTYTKLTAVPASFDSTVQYYKLGDYVNVASDYYPVQYTLSGTTTTTATVGANSAGVVLDKIAKQIKSDAAEDSSSASFKSWTKYVYSNTSTKTVDANNSMATKLALNDETVTWKWDFSTTHDGEDTILGDLVSQDNVDSVNDTHNDTTFTDKGYRVVKASANDSDNEYVVPTADVLSSDKKSITTQNDYNLYTSFDLSLTVTQVD